MMERVLALLAFSIASFAQAPAHQVNLNWSWAQAGGTAATSFNIKRSAAAGGPYEIVGNLGCAITGCLTASYGFDDVASANNTLTPGATYFYVITAMAVASESGNSNEANATVPNPPPPPPPPATPTGLTAVAQ